MSLKTPPDLAAARRQAPVFAAMGDETRLLLLSKLGRGDQLSIAQLTTGSRLTRQAVTKHLHVLQDVGIVQSSRAGRETRFAIRPEPLRETMSYLELVSAQWDRSLARLKMFVESRR